MALMFTAAPLTLLIVMFHVPFFPASHFSIGVEEQLTGAISYSRYSYSETRCQSMQTKFLEDVGPLLI
jgi:hypothetical protein